MYRYKAERTKEYIEFEVRKAYAQLQMAYRSYDILKKSLDDVNTIYQSVSNFYNQGLIQKSDLLNARVQVNTIESALAKAESNIHTASDGLKLLMGEELGSDIYTADPLSYQEQQAGIQTTLSSRSDILAMNKAVEATAMMQKSSTMSYLPRINAFGVYGLNDSEAFKFSNDSYMVGLNVSWTIFAGNQNRSKQKSAVFQHDKMREELDLYIEKEQLELNKTERDLKDAKTDMEKYTASVEQASEALRIMNDRYSEGLVNTTDLLMAQAQLSQQQLLHAQSVMTTNITGAYLSFLSTEKQ
jgi:outer membrane protein TolC